MVKELQGCGKLLSGKGGDCYTLSRYSTKLIMLPGHRWEDASEHGGSLWHCGGRQHSSGYPWICKDCAYRLGLLW